MDDAESLCETAGLAFGKHIEPGVMVEADRALMHQVFQNLVSNAVKHNSVNGSVRIRLSSDASGARFEILNTCAAISEEAKRRLFDRFYRAEDSRSGEGFGLGLNIACELARANGAKLELMPAESGTIGFSLTLGKTLPPDQ
jgi:signal transduction histidine kinase